MNIKKSLWFSFLSLLFFSCKHDKIVDNSLVITPQELVEIPDDLPEISGIIFQTQQYIYAHNDGGHGAYIYEINLMEKKVNKTVKIWNTENVDWEDIAQDSQYIYIGEFGNNYGKRMDLKVLKIAKFDVQNMDSVAAEFINFSYPDQENFETSNDHNFDCEAMITFGDSLFLFSKNRGDFKTKIYSLPKNAGNYSASLGKNFDVDGLITGATINIEKNVIALLGYEIIGGNFKPFLWLFSDFPGSQFFEGKKIKLFFSFNGQMESISFGLDFNLYFAPESESGEEVQYIYQLDCESFLQ